MVDVYIRYPLAALFELGVTLVQTSGVVPHSSLVKHGQLRAAWICAVGSLFFFYELMQMNIIGAMADPIRQSFGLTATQLGELSAFYFMANVIFLPFAGILLDRFSVRTMMAYAMGACVLGTFVFSVAPPLSVAQCARFVVGVGGAFCCVSCMRLASLYVSAQRMALASGLLVAMAMCGGIAAQAPCAWLTQHHGWRFAVRMDALLGVVFWLLIVAVVRDPRVFSERKRAEGTASIGVWQSYRLVFMCWRNWAAGLYAGLLNLPVICLGGFIGISFLTTNMGVSHADASLVTTSLFVGMLLGSPLVGYASDRMQNRYAMMLLGALLTACIMLFLMMTSFSFGVLCLLFFALGLSASTQVLSYPLLVASNPPALTATAVSVVSISCIGLGALFQPLFGYLLDWHWMRHEPTWTMTQQMRMYLASDYYFAAWSLLVVVVLACVLAYRLRTVVERRLSPTVLGVS